MSRELLVAVTLGSIVALNDPTRRYVWWTLGYLVLCGVIQSINFLPDFGFSWDCFKSLTRDLDTSYL